MKRSKEEMQFKRMILDSYLNCYQLRCILRRNGLKPRVTLSRLELVDMVIEVGDEDVEKMFEKMVQKWLHIRRYGHITLNPQ